MTAPTQPAELLALVAKWDKSVDAAEDQRDKDGLSMNHAAAAYHDGLATAYRRCHDELMESLAAHRGEARLVRFVGIDPLNIGAGATEPMLRESWRFAFSEGDDGVLHFAFNDAGPLVATGAHPPQAQAGAGDVARVLLELAEQYDEMAQAARSEDEYDRRDVWENAASQARTRANQPDWISAALEAKP